MDQDTINEIRTLVRSGFYEAETITEIIGEETDGSYSTDELNACIKRCFEEWVQEQAGWPQQTDCDRLDAVFGSLNQCGIVALQNAGYTQSDGYADIVEIYHEHEDKAAITGYCFYHGQDLERAVDGLGLYLAFGPIDTSREEDEGPRIGRLIVQALAQQGFEVKWDGTFNQRIFVPRIDWKRRIE